MKSKLRTPAHPGKSGGKGWKAHSASRALSWKHLLGSDQKQEADLALRVSSLRTLRGRGEVPSSLTEKTKEQC